MRGYSLLEVMVTLVVVGVGLLAIVQLQSGLSGQVGDNKTKAEATTLAEARVETLRNYIDETEYGTKLLATSGFEDVPSGEYNADGVNATFSMQEAISGGDEIREVSVRVSWEDRTGTSQEVTVTSEIAYVSPAAAGQKALLYTRESDLDLPTGSAKPGEGSLPDADQKVVVDNDDGTREAVDGTDKYLLVGDDIQLVLENVCNSETGDCEDDFTRLHGRVYIDRKTYPDLTIGQVNIVASNAAYCTRFYNTLNKPILYEDNGDVAEQSDEIAVVTNQTPEGMTTKTNSDYEYFDYTCYVGSGWYGNIGVYIAEPDETRRRNIKVCMGDPVEEFALQEYVLSAYRAYRGMLYETDANGAIPASIQSIGVAGGLELGFEKTVGSEVVKLRPTHNFVISLLPTSATDPACVDKGILVRSDALPLDGGIFSDSPDDFVCLNNPDRPDDYGLNGYDPDTAVLDAEACPYDPTNETFARDDVSGLVSIVDL